MSAFLWAMAGGLASGAAGGVSLAARERGLPGLSAFMCGVTFGIGAVVIVIALFAHAWGTAIGEGVGLAVFAALWWWHRRRDRAPLALGAKSRALRDALVRKAREAAKPRQVLRPQPGAAR